MNDISIETDSIFFIEQYRNKSTFVTKFKNIEIYSTLKEILPKLPDNFGLCHKSYIVNMELIRCRYKDKCILNSDMEVPIGRLKKNEFRDLYLNFLANSVKKDFCFKE